MGARDDVTRLSGLRYIYEARLGVGASLIQEGFAVLGIAVGVALLFASQVSSTSLTRAVAQLNSQLVGSSQVQLKARDVEGVPEQLLEQVRRAPGVTSASPILERQTNLIGAHGERPVDLIGIEPNALKAWGPLLRRFSGRQLASAKAIALPSSLAKEIHLHSLETVQLQVGAKYVETLVGATLAEEDIGGLEHSPIAVTSLRYARRLTGAPGRLTRIFVHYEPRLSREAVSALVALAHRWNVNLQPSTFESRVFAVAVGPENKSEQVFSGISALVGFMFALNAMLITVPSRRKLIADLHPHRFRPNDHGVADRRRGARSAGVCAGARARRSAVNRGVQRHARLPNLRVSGWQWPDRDVADGCTCDRHWHGRSRSRRLLAYPRDLFGMA